jgi:hypothetical protein
MKVVTELMAGLYAAPIWEQSTSNRIIVQNFIIIYIATVNLPYIVVIKFT